MWSLFFELAACFGFALLARFLPARRTWVGFTIVFGALLALATFLHGTPPGGSTLAGFTMGLVRVGYSFLLGALLQRVSDLAPRAHPLAVLALFVGVLLGPRIGWWSDTLIILFVMPALVWFGAVAKVKNEAVWDALGRLSYPLYLVHWPIISMMDRELRGSVPHLVAFEILASLVSAWLILIFYDEPVRKLLARSGRTIAVAP